MAEVLYRIVHVHTPQLKDMQVDWVVKLGLCLTKILTYNSRGNQFYCDIWLSWPADFQPGPWSHEKTAIIN